MKLVKIITVVFLTIIGSEFAGASVKDVASTASVLQIRRPPPPPAPPRLHVVVRNRRHVVHHRRRVVRRRRTVHITLPHIRLPRHPGPPPGPRPPRP